MALIETARAMDDARFVWRVKAAMLIKAKEEFAKTPTTATKQAFDLAVLVLKSPMMDERTMVALVAVDPAVSELVAIADGDVVSTDAVPDADIQRVVNAEWPNVARKY